MHFCFSHKEQLMYLCFSHKEEQMYLCFSYKERQKYICTFLTKANVFLFGFFCRPRWLSWMSHPTREPSDWRPGGRRFNPSRGRQHSFVEIDHEIFSMVILSLPLIQEGQLSVSGERMCTILVNSLED